MAPWTRLDRMHDGDRGSRRRNPSEHPAGREAFDADQPTRDRIEAAKIEQEPAVELLCLQLSLDLGKEGGSEHAGRVDGGLVAG